LHLQFSVIAHVQERLTAQSNPLHEQTDWCCFSLDSRRSSQEKTRIRVHYFNTEDLLISLPNVLCTNFWKVETVFNQFSVFDKARDRDQVRQSTWIHAVFLNPTCK
jgi:hypothetical protein